MNLEHLVALAQIANALVVTLTLLALIVTIRQNARSRAGTRGPPWSARRGALRFLD